MSETNTPVGDGNQSAVVDDPGGNSNSNGKRSDSNDTVKYENYQRVLSEKRKADERAKSLEAKLAEYENEQKKRQEKTLKEQQKFKELAELKEKEAAEAIAKVKAFEKQREQARKLDAVLNALPGKVQSDYWGLIDTDSVIVNPDTGAIEESSVQAIAKEFQDRHMRLIDLPGNTQHTRRDNEAPKTNGMVDGGLSREEWNKLSAKDKVARYDELEKSSNWMVGTDSHAKKMHNDKDAFR